MYRRKQRSSTKTPSNLEGSDITRPNNSSLLVNRSRARPSDEENTNTNTDHLPLRKFTCILSEDEDENDEMTSPRNSSFAMLSMAKKQQSTPISQSASILKEKEKIKSAKKQTPASKKRRRSLRNEKPYCYFDEVINECGAFMLPADGSYSLATDQTTFSKKLNKLLSENPENVKKFMTDIEKHVENLEYLKKMLAFTQTEEGCDVARGPIQEPLMRLLLNVDVLQPDLVEFLIVKLNQLVVDEASNDEYNFVPAMLRQLRFLNRVSKLPVFDKLCELLLGAPTPVQREVIFFLPEVISEEEQAEASLELIDLLKSSSELTPVIIDALSNLSLNQEQKQQIQNKLMYRLTKCPLEYVPVIVQFILMRTGTDELSKIITGLRKELPFTVAHWEHLENEKSKEKGKEKKKSDDESCIKLTFDHLKFSVMSSKQMTEAWINAVTQIKSAKELKPVDFTILVIMYDAVFGRKTQVLGLLRNLIRTDILMDTHINQVFKVLSTIMKEYSETVLEIAGRLLKSNEHVISDFGSKLYQLCFVHFTFFTKQNVISELLTQVGNGTPSTITVSLATLLTITEQYLDDMTDYGSHVMGLLSKITDLDLQQSKQLFDLIGMILFNKRNDENMKGLQDEFYIFIRKQISSSKPEMLKKGIIGGVSLAKYLVGTDEDDNFFEANTLLELAMGVRCTSNSRRSFFFDELATMIKENNINLRFVESWNKRIHCMLGKIFVKDVDIESDDFPLSLQFGVDISSVTSDKLVLPVVQFFITEEQESKNEENHTSIIPSALHLLWATEDKIKDNLNEILPMLSASLILPDLQVFETFSTLSDRQQKLIMDCLFFSCNFFIECINAFCTQKANNDKVLIRLKQLTNVRKQLSQAMSKMETYTPPLCQFYAPVIKPVLKKRTNKKTNEKKQQRGKKRKSDGTQVNDSDDIDPGDIPPTIPSTAAAVIAPSSNNGTIIDLNQYRSYFRELQIHTFKILKSDMKLQPTTVYKKAKVSDSLVPDCYTYRPSEKLELGPSDLLFILEDFYMKAEHILKESKRVPFLKAKSATACELDHVNATDFIKGCTKFMPKLCTKLETLSQYCKDLLAANDGIWDSAGMFPKDAADIKLCYEYIMRIISEFLSWNSFLSVPHRPLLKGALTSIVTKETPSKYTLPLTTLINDVSEYLIQFTSSTLTLTSALSLVKALQALRQMMEGTAEQRLASKIANVSYDFLTRPWFTVFSFEREQGAIYNQYVDTLLKNYFKNVDDKLNIVKATSETTLEEVKNFVTKDSQMETFKTITKSNFPLLFRVLCESLVNAATPELAAQKDDHEKLLTIWQTIIQTLQLLVEIVKICDSRLNLCSLLKRSQSILQLFLSKGMPVIETALRIKTTEVLLLLKSLQGFTRFLLSICVQSKISSDASMAAHVPAIRSQCERLTLEVKGLMIINKIPSDCIQIAVLKNRDIQGNELSQASNDSDSEDDDDIPPEQDGSEEIDLFDEASSQ